MFRIHDPVCVHDNMQFVPDQVRSSQRGYEYTCHRNDNIQS